MLTPIGAERHGGTIQSLSANFALAFLFALGVRGFSGQVTAIGFMIVALFVLTWVASAAIWRFGRIEERWSARARP